jgi:2-polyprenyl-6-methoxyphenol hydroxylase-like FAD-dependent oxidoreductase
LKLIILPFVMAAATTADVLIIGSGPTGLMLGLELSLQKISFRILDSTAIRSDKSRALVLQSRSQELLRRHGIIEKFHALGRINTGMRVFTNKKFAFEVDLLNLGYTDTEFPTPLIISQAETERLLEERLLEYGAVIEKPVTVEKIEQNGDGVTAHLRKEDGSQEEVKCKYLVGCDGAHSFVRKSCDMDFQGGTYPEDLILADLHLKWEQKDVLTMFMGMHGFMAVFPMKDGVYRIINSRPHHLNDESEPTLADFEESLRELCPGTVEISDPTWVTRFRLHHRVVHDYRKERVFLCGDAAHIHSPAGGQGMNTGIQDAVNLSWKLAMVLRGQKPDRFLDSYNSERHRVGEKLLQRTDRLFEMMATTNCLYLWLRNTLVPWVVPWFMGSRERRAKGFRFVTQLGIRYRHSPVVGTGSGYRGKLRGGDRAPDAGVRSAECAMTIHGLCASPIHHLILFSGTLAGDSKEVDEIEADFAKQGIDWLQVHKISTREEDSRSYLIDPEGEYHDLFEFEEPGYILVRPDGYIAHIGLLSQIAEMKEWLKQ